MKILPLGPLHYEFSRHNEPRLRITPGETVLVEAEDAFSGQIRTNADRRDKTKNPNSNPQTGPIWIEGAEPGDALAVKIEEIRPSIGQCATRTSDPRQLAEWLGDDCPHGVHVCPIRDGQIYWSDDITIPYTPMLGCIGTAPDSGVPTTGPAGPHGGNMDIIETCPGNTIYLSCICIRRISVFGRRTRRNGARRTFRFRAGNAVRNQNYRRSDQRQEPTRTSNRIPDRDYDRCHRLPDGAFDRSGLCVADFMDGGRVRLGSLEGVRHLDARWTDLGRLLSDWDSGSKNRQAIFIRQS